MEDRCLGREWSWDHWDRAEVFPEILREKPEDGRGPSLQSAEVAQASSGLLVFSGTRVAGPSDCRKPGLSYSKTRSWMKTGFRHGAKAGTCELSGYYSVCETLDGRESQCRQLQG